MTVVLTDPDTSTATATPTTNKSTTTAAMTGSTTLNHNHENQLSPQQQQQNEITTTSSNVSNGTTTTTKNSNTINNPTPHRLPEGENAAPLEVTGTTTSDKLVIIMVGLPATGTWCGCFVLVGTKLDMAFSLFF